MAELDLSAAARRRPRGWTAWRNRLVSALAFQSCAARFPLTRRLVRREGAAMFDLLSGFLQSQVLSALVSLGVLRRALERPVTEAILAVEGVPRDRAAILLRAGVAIGLLQCRGDGYIASRRGAALLGVPGLEAMIAHHALLYRDLADPAAFFRCQTETELAGFWPYVFGAGAAADPEAARRYSDLMAESQALVAEETLARVSLRGARHLLDVGRGSGAFALAAARAAPDLSVAVFDLPAVVPQARERFVRAGLEDRLECHAGSFRDDPLPQGADAISLVRVLYDHSDDAVAALLAAVRAAVPPGGRLIVSEPMTGGGSPTVPGDVYFALYCLAMRTGRARSAAEIAALLSAAGFERIRIHPSGRAFVTSGIEARAASV